MTVSFGKGAFELFLDQAQFDRDLKGAEAKLRAFSGSIRSLGAALLTVGSIATAAFGSTVKAAADAEEAVNKFNVIFADAKDEAREFADTLADKVGRSVYMLMDGMAELQGILQGYGLSAQEALKYTKLLSAAALDTASIHNKDDADVIHDFSSAISGSSETVQKYGINIKEAMVEIRLAEMGMDGLTGKALEQAKVMAKAQMIMDSLSSRGILGDAERTSGSLVNQTKALSAEIEKAKIAIGSALLPVVQKLIPPIVKLAQDFAVWADENQELVVMAAKASVGLVALGGALLGLSTALNTIATAMGAVSLIMGSVTAGGPLLAAGFVAAGIAAAALIKELIELHYWLAKVYAEQQKTLRLTNEMAAVKEKFDKKSIELAREMELKNKGSGVADLQGRLEAFKKDRGLKLARLSQSGIKENEKKTLGIELKTLDDRIARMTAAIEELQTAHEDHQQALLEESAAISGVAQKIANDNEKKAANDAAVKGGVKGSFVPSDPSEGEKFLKSITSGIKSGFLNSGNIEKFLKDREKGFERQGLVEEIANAKSPSQLAGIISQVMAANESLNTAAGANKASELGTAGAQQAIQDALRGSSAKDQTELLKDLVELTEEAQAYRERKDQEKEDELERETD